ncbi:DUF4396 domain-containing protein [Zhouia sp. PK063]|uniref:DUF4396 domain-containing protein n=1 Tax=Zhouia sp. PK063 TaxID=3373602 RepID=UPI0037B32455
MLYQIAKISLMLSCICCFIILIDLLNGHKQHMMIMNIVYPITALYAGPIALFIYFTLGRKSTHIKIMNAKKHHETPPPQQKPFWQSVVVGALHCGSGCTLADIIAESVLLLFPFTLFGKEMFGAWAVDFILALFIGILFQYYAIKPMKNLSIKKGIKAAIKSDVLSLTFWQIGMYGWMAIAVFLIFKHELKATSTLFWFMMQIAMFFGFFTAYPINWWLIKKGIKEKM